AMSTWPSPRVDRLSTPKTPAIRFARAMTFVASWFTHLLRPARLLAPRYGSDHLHGQRGLLLPGFQRDEPVAGYNYSSDWTPLLTGLSPARMAASLAAPTPPSTDPASAPTTPTATCSAEARPCGSTATSTILAMTSTQPSASSPASIPTASADASRGPS